MTRAIRFHETGGPEVLQYEEVEVGAPGRGEVRVNVEAIGLNRAEAMFRSGAYLEDPKLPAGFDEIIEAHKYMESNQQFGKIVVSVPNTV